ncbi:hypothetical protein DPMN_122837 [Dreissena polymorpha]|uniref:Uncharacterized protein n=1 Tax=Dreissena polymorpha TaxID=45954 RepID=A0A9D4GQ56_DREPO|nr:hypothetical protein DPMN_122837 [Dreissena polymorpha]
MEEALHLPKYSDYGYDANYNHVVPLSTCRLFRYVITGNHNDFIEMSFDVNSFDCFLNRLT